MKVCKNVKKILLSSITTLFFVIVLIFNQNISKNANNDFIYFSSQIIPFVIIILLIAYGVTLSFGIEDNLWDEFKVGRDHNIDRMMKNLKINFF